MKKKIFFLLFLMPLVTFGQDFQWARHIEGTDHDTANAIEIDNDGNTYTFGTTSSLLFDIDPTNGQQIIDNTSNNGGSSSQSIYLTKLDPNGGFLWGQAFNTFSYYDKAIDIKIGTDGNIYLLAMTGEYDLSTSIYHNYITIIKLNQNGNILLTKRLTNLNYPAYYNNFSAASFDLDNQNNIFITGHFAHFLKLDETNPLFNLSSGYKDSFLLKLDSTGNLIFARKFDINYTNDHFERVNVASDGNLNLLLSNGDNQSLTNYGYNILKVNSQNGNILWQKYFDNQSPTLLNTDNNGNIIIVGQGKNSYGSQIDVDPSANQNLIPPTKYILWLDSSGNFIEAKSYTSTGIGPTMFFSKIISDSNNNTYVIGNFYFQFDADPSSNAFMLVNTTLSYCSDIYHSVFSIKFDNNRNFVTAFKFGQYSTYCPNVWARDIKIHNDYQYYVGDFGHAYMDLDPSENDYPFNISPINSPYGDGYILKLGPCDSLMPNGENNQTFCSNQNATISSLLPNNGSIRWYNSLTSTVQLASNTSLVNGQTYYASKQVGNCPESPRLPVTVSINQSPTVPIASNQTFCESQNAVLTDLLVTGQNIEYYDSLINGNILSNTTVLLNGTSYFASQTLNDCQSDRTTISVTITPSPAPSVTSPQTFCIQQNATVNNIAITGQNIQWYDAPTGGNLLNSTTALQNGTTYYASQTLNSCESSRVSVTINIQNTPAPIGNSPQSFCALQNPTLNDITVTGTAINWYSSTTSTTVLPSNTLLVDGTVYFATQTVNGCESINRLAITISLIFSLNASDYATNVCDEGNNGTEMVDLSQFDSFLINTSGNTFSYYKTYNGTENQIIGEELATNHTLNLGLNIIYVRIDSMNGCHQIVQLQLTLVPVPIITIPDEIILCERGIVSVQADSGFDSYLWSTNATSPSIVINQAGNYSVTVTENHGSVTCSSTKNFTVVLSNAPTITSIDTVDWTDSENSITVNAVGLGDYEYAIDGINFQNSNVFNGLPNGAYLVTVRDKKECGIATEQVFLLNYPKFFTPNSDGNNDGWSIKFSQFEPNFEVRIFDRYGKLLRVMKNNEAWDGNYNGRQLPSDDYWFNVIRNDGRIHKGHFAMLR